MAKTLTTEWLIAYGILPMAETGMTETTLADRNPWSQEGICLCPPWLCGATHNP